LLVLTRAVGAHGHAPGVVLTPDAADRSNASVVAASGSPLAQAPGATIAPTARIAGSGTLFAQSAADEVLCRQATATGENKASELAADPAVLAAARRLDTALRSSPDAFSQAVAAWVGEEESDLTQRQDKLARLAALTSDPRVYALAFRECRKSSAEASAPNCRALSARQWAQLDRGNALPWLYELDDATDHTDLVARDEALYQIAASARIEERPFAAARVIVEHAGTDGAGLVAANTLVAKAQGLADTQTLPIYALLDMCHSGLDDEAGLTQPCTRAADLLVRRSDALGLRRIGGAMDFAITGDSTRRDRVRDKSLLLGSAEPPHEEGGCASLRETLNFRRRAGEVGEVVALRERAGGPGAP
jgi:hypothetical protein